MDPPPQRCNVRGTHKAMSAEIAGGAAIEVAGLLLLFIIPGAVVFFVASRWGRRGAWMAAIAGDLWSFSLFVSFFYMALGCHGCEPVTLTRTWTEVLGTWVLAIGRLFVVLWPLHLIWLVVALLAGVLGVWRHARSRRRP
jgi:hypothetical protein